MTDYQSYLNMWHEDDERGFDSPVIARNITIISKDLTWGGLVTSGTLKLVENQVKLTAEKLVKEQLPRWLHLNYKISVVTRVSMNRESNEGIASSSAYVVVDTSAHCEECKRRYENQY